MSRFRDETHTVAGRANRRLNRKIVRSQWALFFERMWPRVWVTLAAVLAFLALSFFGAWSALPTMAHQGVLGLLAIVGLGGLVYAARTPFPARDDALRAMESQSGLAHRPATTLEDTLAADADPRSRALWEAHQRRMAERAEKIRTAPIEPKTYRYDPMAIRAAAVILVAVGAGFAGSAIPDRLKAAFDFGRVAELTASTRLDAWITPPTYTARPPVILADGGQSRTTLSADGQPNVPEVPQGSVVRVRVSGDRPSELKILGLTADGATVSESTDPNATADDGGSSSKKNGEVTDVSSSPSGEENEPVIREAILELGPEIAALQATIAGVQVARWDVKVIPDRAPTIRMTKDIETTRRGAMKLFYEVKDDFGLANAEARLEALPPDEKDPRTQWARPDVLTGPKLPLARPPKIDLRLPPRNSKNGETWSFHEIGSHPWAGMRVRMTLIAKDHAGNIGKSKPIEMRLPERQFLNPLARAVIEQRRNLVVDSRYVGLVRKALAALTLAPDGFIRDLGVYTGLRSVYHRLREDQSRAGIQSAIEQLWHIARRIEDGRGLSAAERRLRELQERLAKAIENGASDQELQELMKQLREAMAEFMQQLARQSQQQMQPPQGLNQNSQTLTQQDLNRMMDQLENMARQGSKDAAQEMLSQLRDLIDRMQSGRMAQRGQQGQQQQQMMQMMDQFGNIIGQQQRLMDDTFGQQRQGQQGQQGQRGQQAQRGQQGQQGQGQRGQRGQPGQGRGQRPGRGQQGRGGQQRPGQGGRGQLAQRQGQLGQALDQLQQQMQGLGMQSPGQLGGARDSMSNAREALERGDLETATREQQRALEQLRQGAQQMAQQMMQQMPSRYGRAGEAPLDPLGRPQRTDGPDLGTSVKVPEEIEMQRAREILEELRRRLGQPQRPEIELDYIERLLERF